MKSSNTLKLNEKNSPNNRLELNCANSRATTKSERYKLKMNLTKFDVAERQLLQSIRLFFKEEDPVSIHTLSEAALQVLRDIAGEFGTRSRLRDNDLIRPEKKKEWYCALAKSKNFFKHANRDKKSIHKLDPETNSFTILDAVSIYADIKKEWVPETKAFTIWFFLKYPDLLKEESDFTRAIKSYLNPSLDHENKFLFLEMITKMRTGFFVIDHITTKYGL